MLKNRFVFYALFIVAAVGAGVLILDRQAPPERAAYGFRPPATPKTPWEPTAERIAKANDGFSVDSSRPENKPLAGQDTPADWPQFNGIQRDNKSSETGLLKEWPKEGPPLVWMAKGVGVGYSTVAVVDGVVYTMGNKGESEAIIALDLGTGEKIWSTPFAPASQLSAGNGPRSTPTVNNGLVFGLGGNGDLACLEAATGKLRWQKNILREFEGGVPGWGICESVLIDGDKLICTPGGTKGTLVALNPSTGDLLWKSVAPEKDGAGYASPLAAEIGGVRQYVQFTSRGTLGVRADDGEFLWRENSAANGTANCSSPLVDGDLVFCASGYGNGGALVKLASSSSKTTAKLVYKTKEMKSHHGDMVIVDGLLFGSDEAILTCLELGTGKIKWQNRSVGKGSVTFADGRIYLRSESGPIALVEATGEAYREHGKFEQPHRSGSSAWPHPVVAAGKLFLRDQDVLLCYDVKAK